MFVRQPRVAMSVGAVAASTVVAGATLLGVAPVAPAQSSGLITQVQREIDLYAYPTFEQSVKYLLNDMLGLGNKTLGGVFDPDNDLTMDTLLGASGLSTTDSMTQAFDALGLDNISFGAILGPLAANDTLNDLLGTGGAWEALGSQTMNEVFVALGGVDQSLADALNNLGLGGMEIGQLLSDVGISTGTDVEGLLTAIGLEQLDGFLPLLGLSGSTDALVAIDHLTGGMITSTTTLYDLLGPGGLLDAIGGMRFGSFLGIADGDTDTLLNFLDSITWDSPNPGDTLGDQTLATVMGWLTLDPTTSISENLSGLPIQLDGSTDLGSASIGAFLTSLMNPADIAGTADPEVVGTTTLSDFLDSMFGPTMTLNEFLGLDSVIDWVGPP